MQTVVVFLLLLADIGASAAKTFEETRGSQNGSEAGGFILHSPENILIDMTEEIEVLLNYSLTCSFHEETIGIMFESENYDTFDIITNTTMLLKCPDVVSRLQPVGVEGQVRIKIRGNLIGIANLNVSWHSTSHFGDTDTEINDNVTQADDIRKWQTFAVSVLRRKGIIDIIFMPFVTVLICFLGVAFGFKLDLGIVKECLKNPLAPLIGLCCQFIIMPLLGLAIGKAIASSHPTVALGIFLCSICPGGGFSNMYTYLFDGDVSLSITMTFISTVASIGVIPLLVTTLGRIFLQGTLGLTIPYTSLIGTIAMITIPLVIGVLIKHKFPQVALKTLKVLKPVTFVFILIVMAIGIYTNLYIFSLFRPIHIIAGCLLPYFGYILGSIFSVIFRQPKNRVVTIAIETGQQNVGVAYVLIQTSFPAPISDISSVAPMASSMMTPIPLLIGVIFYTIYKKCCDKYENVPSEFEESVEVKKKTTKNGGAINGVSKHDDDVDERLTSV